LSEGTESRAALIEAKALEKRLPVCGANDYPAPRAELSGRIPRQNSLELGGVLQTGSGIVARTAEELLTGERTKGRGPDDFCGMSCRMQSEKTQDAK
jgi:hypothetical protein